MQVSHPYTAYLKQIFDLKVNHTSLASAAGFTYEVESSHDVMVNTLLRADQFKGSRMVEFLGEMCLLYWMT